MWIPQRCGSPMAHLTSLRRSACAHAGMGHSNMTRAAAIARLGHGYRALLALVALAGLVWIIYGYGQYRAHDWIQVWSPPAFMRHITVGLMLFAVMVNYNDLQKTGLIQKLF